jgi:hypothetical protein
MVIASVVMPPVSPYRCCRSRVTGAGVLRPRRRRQYRPASYSQTESKCDSESSGLGIGSQPGLSLRVGPLSPSH